ncbi:DUF1295 domain-containing protein [Jiangella alkaliphila]|uniref:Steroid 5-alpha reductase family enzyme n=1 Tax=Jiangella alkaliphila TaxID=419479 RepID=A0A1H2LG07_9ACTN|nr:DUF1295 domain-containing protein [Jiangella alkaliphila]SDU79558.1 Steroid 5-alpha reductase family enzyme [Jiangella alkaliphila]
MGGVAWAGLGVNLGLTAVAVVVLMAGVVLWVARGGAVVVIDTVWGAGFALVAVVTWLASAGDGDGVLRALVTVLTVMWGVRLAVHLHRRNHGKGEDPRYEDLFARHAGGRTRVAALWVCLPQAVILWFVSLPVQVAQYVTIEPAWWLVALGVLVWAVGLVFEAVGDAQLARFKADPVNRGRIMDRGLWRYTRHPNYFGDASVWWGLYLCACVTRPGAATVLSPLLMTFFLARGTGKPMTEQRMADRPGYAEYVERTSGFVPLPPRHRGR